MVDIHSHVLYGMDDGARTLEDSVDMMRMAAAHGTTDIVATPHANPRYPFDPLRIRERIAEITEASGGAPRLYSGCDFHLSYDNIQDAIANPRKYTIAQKSFLLVEFSDLIVFHNTADIFARLEEAGMVPVITHPERNPLLRQRIEEIAKWVGGGARLQVTAQSLFGDFGRDALQFSKTLLDRNLVHFIASDGHDCERRPPQLDQAHAWLRKNYGDDLAETLCVTNPRLALEGGELEVAEQSAPSEPRKWYQRWR